VQKRCLVACRFSKGFPDNPGNVSTNRKSGDSLPGFKSFWRIQQLLVFTG
jgi:hypothetical protein